MRNISKLSSREAFGLKAFAFAKLPLIFFSNSASPPPWNILITRFPPFLSCSSASRNTSSARRSLREVSTVRFPVVIGAASERTVSYGPISTSFALISLEKASPVSMVTVGGIGSRERGLRSTETIFPFPFNSSLCVKSVQDPGAAPTSNTESPGFISL